MKKDNCIFCKIVAGEIPSHTTYEDENCKVILDINPATKGHSIIIVKDHYDNFFELPEEKAAEVIKVAKIMSKKKKIRSKLRTFSPCKKFSICYNILDEIAKNLPFPKIPANCAMHNKP